jgi:hypothetical protein
MNGTAEPLVAEVQGPADVACAPDHGYPL